MGLPETGRQEKIWRRVTRTGNAQTADVRGPEPRPAVELPIMPHNVSTVAAASRPEFGGMVQCTGWLLAT